MNKLSNLSPALLQSQLFDESTFYRQFIADLRQSTREVIIESPYITSQRMNLLTSSIQSLIARNVKVYVLTRSPDDHDLTLKQQAESEIRNFEAMGVQVLISAKYSHRKLAIIDRKVLWEGSLNILSQAQSGEIMRRIDSELLARECFNFINLGRYI